MRMIYRDTPYPATGVSSCQAIANRRTRTKLDYTIPINNTHSKQDEEIDVMDAQYKSKIERTRRNRAKEHNISVGDYVLVKQKEIQQVVNAF